MRTDELTSPAFERVVLEKVKIALTESVSPIFLHDLTLHQAEDVFSDRIALQFRAYILGREGKSEEWRTVEGVEDVPETWWDHLKAALWQRWPRLRNRLHFRTRRIETEVEHHASVWHVCPHGNMTFPGRHVEFMQYDGSRGYAPLNIESKVREAVELWRSGAARDWNADRALDFDRAMHAIRVALDKADRANGNRR